MLPNRKKEDIPYGDIQILLYRQKRNRRKDEMLYYLKQRLSGAVLVSIGIIAPFLCDGDATISLFLLPLGIFLMVTKEKVMIF